MDFSLSDEQAMIRDSSRRFMAKHYTLERWTKTADAGGFCREHWKLLADLGFLSVGQPEAYGGVGGPVELALICQEFGRGLLLEPYVGAAVICARLISAAGTERQKSSLLPAIMSGECIVCLAHAERDSPWSGRIASTATPEGDVYTLNGTKNLVLAGAHADLLIVSVRSVSPGPTEEPAFFLVDPAQSGVIMANAPLLDRSWCANISFSNVTVAASDRLGTGSGGGAALADAVRYANLAVCAEMVGIIDRAFELAVEYSRVREQFGARISTFQALRHKLADMAIDREMARATLFVLLACLQDPRSDQASMTTAMAKAYLGEIGRRVCAQAIQVHGAMGMTAQCGVGRYFARANVINSLFGQTDFQFAAYTRLLVDKLKSEQQSDTFP